MIRLKFELACKSSISPYFAENSSDIDENNSVRWSLVGLDWNYSFVEFNMADDTNRLENALESTTPQRIMQICVNFVKTSDLQHWPF